MKIGVYPGTFDPIHQGHMSFALATLQQLKLDRIIFLPEEEPRGKQNVTSLSHRIALIERSIEDIPSLRIARLHSTQFTVSETLPELQELFPDDELIVLLGSDVARHLGQWQSIDQFVRYVHLAIAARANDEKTDIIKSLQSLMETLDVSIEYTLIETNNRHVSSSQIRNNSAMLASQPYTVTQYIQANNLYAHETSMDTSVDNQ